LAVPERARMTRNPSDWAANGAGAIAAAAIPANTILRDIGRCGGLISPSYPPAALRATLKTRSRCHAAACREFSVTHFYGVSSQQRDISRAAWGAWRARCPCGRGGIGRRAGFRFQWRKSWGFESLRPHHAASAATVSSPSSTRGTTRSATDEHDLTCR
jgi:hypothetical protein